MLSQSEAAHLSRLRHLLAAVPLPDIMSLDMAGLTSMSRLNGLSLEFSKVSAARNVAEGIAALTNLTYLNLSRSCWYKPSDTKGMSSPRADPLSLFVGRPGLKIVRVAGCNLFGNMTETDVAGTGETQVSWAKHGINSSRLCLCPSQFSLSQVLSLPSDPHVVNCLVELRVGFVLEASAVQIGEGHLLASYRHLRVLGLFSRPSLQ